MPLTPSATRTDTPVPYATLFRSDGAVISAGDAALAVQADPHAGGVPTGGQDAGAEFPRICEVAPAEDVAADDAAVTRTDRTSTRLNSSHYCASRTPSSACQNTTNKLTNNAPTTNNNTNASH